MRTAVVSGAFGAKYERMASVTRPNQSRYASRIGAEFLTLGDRRFPQATAHWEKLQLRDLLEAYERVLWLDCDVIVRGDCPSLFEVVPEPMVGGWDESVVGPWDYPGFVRRWSERLGIAAVPYPGWHFNTGVLVLSRRHSPILERPPDYPGYELLWDQGWLNFGAARHRFPLMDFGWKFNHLFLCPGERLQSYVIHYCGTVNGSGYARFVPPDGDTADLIRKDLEAWGP